MKAKHPKVNTKQVNAVDYFKKEPLEVRSKFKGKPVASVYYFMNTLFRQHIVNTGKCYRFPYSLGRTGLKKNINKEVVIPQFNNDNKPLINRHSDYYIVNFFFKCDYIDKNTKNAIGKQVKFYPTKPAKNGTGKVLKENLAVFGKIYDTTS